MLRCGPRGGQGSCCGPRMGQVGGHLTKICSRALPHPCLQAGSPAAVGAAEGQREARAPSSLPCTRGLLSAGGRWRQLAGAWWAGVCAQKPEEACPAGRWPCQARVLREDVPRFRWVRASRWSSRGMRSHVTRFGPVTARRLLPDRVDVVGRPERSSRGGLHGHTSRTPGPQGLLSAVGMCVHVRDALPTGTGPRFAHGASAGRRGPEPIASARLSREHRVCGVPEGCRSPCWPSSPPPRPAVLLVGLCLWRPAPPAGGHSASEAARGRASHTAAAWPPWTPVSQGGWCRGLGPLSWLVAFPLVAEPPTRSGSEAGASMSGFFPRLLQRTDPSGSSSVRAGGTILRAVAGSSVGVQSPDLSLIVKYIFAYQPSNLINGIYENRKLNSFSETLTFLFLSGFSLCLKYTC